MVSRADGTQEGMELFGLGAVGPANRGQSSGRGSSKPPDSARTGDFVLAVERNRKNNFLLRVSDARNGKIRHMVSPQTYNDIVSGAQTNLRGIGVPAKDFGSIYTFPSDKTAALERYSDRYAHVHGMAAPSWDTVESARGQLHQVMRGSGSSVPISSPAQGTSSKGTPAKPSVSRKDDDCITKEDIAVLVKEIRGDQAGASDVSVKGTRESGAPKARNVTPKTRHTTRPEPIGAYDFDPGAVNPGSTPIRTYQFTEGASNAGAGPTSVPPYDFQAKATPTRTLMGMVGGKARDVVLSATEGRRAEARRNRAVREQFQSVRRSPQNLGQTRGQTRVNINMRDR